MKDEADFFADFVLDYARARCLDTDGNLIAVDVKEAELYAGGKKLSIRDGLMSDSVMAVGCISFDNGVAAFNL